MKRKFTGVSNRVCKKKKKKKKKNEKKKRTIAISAFNYFARRKEK